MKAKYKILFITDSLGFPRCEPELVMYDDTYLSRLKAEFPECDFIHHGRGGATIVELFKHSAYYHETLKPDLVFMHTGIVDSAPRALTNTEQQIISRLPLVSKTLTALVKRYSHLLRRVRKTTYTSVGTFSEFIAKFEAIFGNMYWINILPVLEPYEAKLSGIGRNTELYRAILRQYRAVSTDQFTSADMMSDFHHLSCQGHQKMYVLLSQVIRRELCSLIQAEAALNRPNRQVRVHEEVSRLTNS